ncbi:MAG: hypothetical protein IKJ05_09225, partial [Oscillospiraceae bacterium]|nr:hypothetical protein [Oscillospiraceae bacterium]
MADSKLKRALIYAFNQNIDDMPPIQELEHRYSFSERFEEKMELLIHSVNKKYYCIFGFTFPKYILGLIFTMAVAISIAMLKYRDIIDYSQARFLFAVAELILLTVFGISTKKISYNMTRTLQTGFKDYDETEQEDDLKFPVPVPPENYTKTNEYRTSSSHNMEFTDTIGRIIYYNRIDIRTGVLNKIDSPDEVKTIRVGQWHAVW